MSYFIMECAASYAVALDEEGMRYAFASVNCMISSSFFAVRAC